MEEAEHSEGWPVRRAAGRQTICVSKVLTLAIRGTQLWSDSSVWNGITAFVVKGDVNVQLATPSDPKRCGVAPLYLRSAQVCATPKGPVEKIGSGDSFNPHPFNILWDVQLQRGTLACNMARCVTALRRNYGALSLPQTSKASLS